MVGPVSTAPITAVIPSSSIRLKLVTASVESPLSSYSTTSICLPLMPPAALAWSMYRRVSPEAAVSPPSSAASEAAPVEAVSSAAELPSLPPQAARDSDIMAARVSASIFFMLDSSRFFKSATGSYSAQGAVKCLF